MFDNETIVLHNSRANYIRLLIVSTLFVTCGGSIVYKEPANWTGWLCIIFFGLGVIVALRQLCDPKPRIIIDEHGITDNTLKIGLIEWLDIENAHLNRVERQHFIELELASENKYLDRLSGVQKGFAAANRATGFQSLSINLSGVKCNPNEILNVVRIRSDHARSG